MFIPQDPSEPGSSVIVVRSVVSGGAAALDGRLAPGDRLVSVNGADVARSALAAAVSAIKTAPRGDVLNLQYTYALRVLLISFSSLYNVVI